MTICVFASIAYLCTCICILGEHNWQEHVASFLNKYTKHTLYSQSDPASLAVTASAVTMSSAIDTMLPTHQRFVISTILCTVVRLQIMYTCKYSQLKSAIPVVDIYDNVSGDIIDPAYSTIHDIHPTHDQQRYNYYIVCTWHINAGVCIYEHIYM